MAIKKVAPKKIKKTPAPKTAVKAAVKKVAPRVKKVAVEPEAPVNFPVKTFIIVAMMVFVFSGLFLMWWGVTNSDPNNVDSNSWIYSRHKFDQYRAEGCGGDPLVTMPNCPRVK